MNVKSPLQANELSRFVRLSNSRPSRSVEDEIEDLDFHSVLFVGSGAILNGWKPIDSLCKNIIANSMKGFVDYGRNNAFFYNDPLDHFLTSFAFLDTSIRSRMSRHLEDDDFLQSHSWKMYSNAIALRENLAQLFCSETSLSLRKLDHQRYGIDLEKTVVITSNWDNCVWAEKNFKNVIYLHGQCEIENSLILPTQFVTDEHALKSWIDLRLKIQDNNYAKVLKNVIEVAKLMRAKPNFVSGGKRDIQLEINYSHDLFREIASSKKTKKVFVWGYGFNLYDAEVNMLLTLMSVTELSRAIDILNPDPTVLIKASQVLAREIKNIGYHHPTK